MSEKLLTAALDKALSRITDETGLVGGVVNVIKTARSLIPMNTAMLIGKTSCP